METFIDVGKSPMVSDIFIDLHLAIEIVYRIRLSQNVWLVQLRLTLDESWNFGPALDTTECGASPDTARNQLESIASGECFDFVDV